MENQNADRFHSFSIFSGVTLFESSEDFKAIKTNVVHKDDNGHEDKEDSCDYVFLKKNDYICHGHYLRLEDERREKIYVEEVIFPFNKHGDQEFRFIRLFDYDSVDPDGCLNEVEINENKDPEFLSSFDHHFGDKPIDINNQDSLRDRVNSKLSSFQSIWRENGIVFEPDRNKIITWDKPSENRGWDLYTNL
jgi:hypothetical protein